MAGEAVPKRSEGMKVARSAYVTLKSLIFAKQKATLKIRRVKAR